MTLGELILCGLIKDEDTIAVHFYLIGNLKQVRRGQWYQDHMLDVADKPIDTLKYCCGD